MSNVETKIFALKLAAKQITNSGKKLKKEETKEMEKCWKRVMRGELVVGRMHAENAVRNRNQSKDLLTLGARLQGAVNVLQTTKLQNKMTSAMKSVVLSMASATRDMNIRSLTATMNRFERMTDHLNVRQAYANEALDDSAADADQVELLMARIADRVRLDLKNEMPGTARDSQTASLVTTLPSSSAPTETTGLDEKLAKLRNDCCTEENHHQPSSPSRF